MPRRKRKNFKSPKGMRDILPQEQRYWLHFYDLFHELALAYGFNYIDPPILEEKELFERSLGDTSEVVTQKEMYTLKTKGGDELVLRPEFTAGIVRAYIEHGLFSLSQPLKLYAVGPAFRHERPQAGRQRQFHQANLEILGGRDAVLDAQVILVIYSFLRELGIDNATIQINSIGCSQCRPNFKKGLKDHYRSYQKKLCRECRARYANNPLRLLSCEQEKCQQVAAMAPHQVDYLCKECHNHFKNVLEYLDELKIPYFLNFQLVRGLDYYTKTVFEFWPEEEIEKSRPISLASGGRYDDLVKQLDPGGREAPAIGGAVGLERAMEYMKNHDIKLEGIYKPEIFLVQLGELGKRKSLHLFQEFRKAGLRVAESFGRSSIQAQLKVANKMGAPWALILGQKEALNDSIIIRDMDSGSQEIVPLSKVVSEIQKRIKGDKHKIIRRSLRYKFSTRQERGK